MNKSGHGLQKLSETTPQEVLLRRLEQSEDLRNFAIQAWLQNPALAQQGGAKVQALLTPLKRTN